MRQVSLFSVVFFRPTHKAYLCILYIDNLYIKICLRASTLRKYFSCLYDTKRCWAPDMPRDDESHQMAHVTRRLRTWRTISIAIGLITFTEISGKDMGMYWYHSIIRSRYDHLEFKCTRIHYTYFIYMNRDSGNALTGRERRPIQALNVYAQLQVSLPISWWWLRWLFIVFFLIVHV